MKIATWLRRGSARSRGTSIMLQEPYMLHAHVYFLTECWPARSSRRSRRWCAIPSRVLVRVRLAMLHTASPWEQGHLWCSHTPRCCSLSELCPHPRPGAVLHAATLLRSRGAAAPGGRGALSWHAASRHDARALVPGELGAGWHAGLWQPVSSHGAGRSRRGRRQRRRRGVDAPARHGHAPRGTGGEALRRRRRRAAARRAGTAAQARDGDGGELAGGAAGGTRLEAGERPARRRGAPGGRLRSHERGRRVPRARAAARGRLRVAAALDVGHGGAGAAGGWLRGGARVVARHLAARDGGHPQRAGGRGRRRCGRARLPRGDAGEPGERGAGGHATAARALAAERRTGRAAADAARRGGRRAATAPLRAARRRDGRRGGRHLPRRPRHVRLATG
eukprot:scaffold1837_cov72-Phaeocystis_antarctica.AAC.1